MSSAVNNWRLFRALIVIFIICVLVSLAGVVVVATQDDLAAVELKNAAEKQTAQEIVVPEKPTETPSVEPEEPEPEPTPEEPAYTLTFTLSADGTSYALAGYRGNPVKVIIPATSVRWRI